MTSSIDSPVAARDRSADVFEVDRRVGLVLPGHDADQTDRARLPNRQDQAEAVARHADIEPAVGGLACADDVGDIEDGGIGAAGETDAERMPHGAVGAVAAAQIGGLDDLGPAVADERGGNPACRRCKAGEFGAAFDAHPLAFQPGDENAFMHVLRQRQHERERAEAGAEIAERQPADGAAAFANGDALDPDPGRHHLVGKSDLAVEFERPRMHGQGTRGLAGRRAAIDDAKPHAELAEPQRQHQAGRPGTNDENVRLHAAVPLREPSRPIIAGRTGRSRYV